MQNHTLRVLQQSRAFRIFKEHILPVLLVFLIPVFSIWFFKDAESRMDREILAGVEKSVDADNTMSDKEKSRTVAFFHRIPISSIMSSDAPDLAQLQKNFEGAAFRFRVFRWMIRLGWMCLLTIFVTFLLVGLSAWYSMRSQAALYQSLRVGWTVLKVSAAIQVLGQAILAAMLSFWVAALWTEHYYPKLMLVTGLLALAAIIALFKAIFTKVDSGFSVEGVLLTADAGDTLHRRVSEIANALQTDPPEHIIMGIDSNFFVTTHPVTLRGEVLQGRTLFLSLPLLKILSTAEADSILAHELAHFSGNDTFWSRKISPITGKFALYLDVLGSGLSSIIARFMHFFWKLYSLSINRHSRMREFRADELGASMVSKDALIRALVKTTGYCEYRTETEQAILRKQRVDTGLRLSHLLESGFPAFLSKFVEDPRALQDRVTHPFDSHPSLASRMARMGFGTQDISSDPLIRQAPADSWYNTIPDAGDWEQRMWSQREEDIQTFHVQDLAWRLLPRDEEEAAIVSRVFPRMVFQKTNVGAEATITYDCVELSDWENPIFFREIESVQLDEMGWPRNRLTLTHKTFGESKSRKTRFYPAQFKNPQADLLVAFKHYYSRFKTAEIRSAQET